MGKILIKNFKMKTIDQDAIIEMANQILDANLKDGSYVINVYEIVDGEHVFKFKYGSFLEFTAKINDDCDSLDTYNNFYLEWTDEE